MSGSRWVRLFGAAVILASLVGFGILLLPVYVRNFQFQRSMAEIASDSESAQRSDDLLRISVIDRAARLGLPIQSGQVQMRRTQGHVSIDVRYAVPIDLPLYSVRLHFHPTAGN